MTHLEILIVAGTLLLAGGIKGVVGLGLPTVTLGVLTAALGLHPAMAIMVVPSFATNVYQAVAGGHGKEVLRRIWPFLFTAILAIGLGAQALSRLDAGLLSALLGLLLIGYAAIGLTRPPLALPRAIEPWAGPVTGAVNGILTGMTGSSVFPGVLYLQALGLPRDRLIQAMGMLFAVSAAALGLALGVQDFMTTQLAWISAGAVVPAVVGMALGQFVRGRLSEVWFRRAVFLALLALGVTIIVRHWTF